MVEAVVGVDLKADELNWVERVGVGKSDMIEEVKGSGEGGSVGLLRIWGRGCRGW